MDPDRQWVAPPRQVAHQRLDQIPADSPGGAGCEVQILEPGSGSWILLRRGGSGIPWADDREHFVVRSRPLAPGRLARHAGLRGQDPAPDVRRPTGDARALRVGCVPKPERPRAEWLESQCGFCSRGRPSRWSCSASFRASSNTRLRSYSHRLRELQPRVERWIEEAGLPITSPRELPKAIRSEGRVGLRPCSRASERSRRSFPASIRPMGQGSRVLHSRRMG